MMRKRNLYAGVSAVGLLVALGVGQYWLSTTAAAQAGGAKQAPRFEVDPWWPAAAEPLAARQHRGVSVDSRRTSGSSTGARPHGHTKAGLSPPTSAHCCRRAPPIIDSTQPATSPDRARTVRLSVVADHGITVESDGTV
jgi:hypothetical protein